MRRSLSGLFLKLAFAFILSLFLVIGIAAAWGRVAWAKEPATPELTFQQAVELAINHSKSLKNTELAIERTEEVRKYVADKVHYTPAGPNPDPAAARAFTALVMADLNWQMTKKKQSAEKDAVTLSAIKAYCSVLQALENVRAAELNYQSSDLACRSAIASFNVGVLSRYGLIQAEAGLAGAKSTLEAAQKALDDAYQQFNQLIGLWPEDRPVLTERPAFSPLQIDNLDTEVERAVEENPSLWLARKNIDLAKLNLDLYTYNNPQEAEPYKAKEIKTEEAEVSAASTEEQMRKLVRTIYYNIRQLEENYAGIEQKLAVAEENLRITRLKYELGMAIKTDVISAQAALTGTQKTLIDAACQHEVLKLAFRKPWAYAASAG